MNRADTRKNPTKEKSGKESVNVEEEFCTRAFSLLASFYETPSITEIVTFPPVKKSSEAAPEKKIAFSSNLADLRLKRAQAKQLERCDSINESIATRIEEMAEIFKTSTVDLDDVFLPEQASRSDLPIYLRNQQKDERMEYEKSMRKTQYRPMEMAEIQKEYSQRLETAKQKGVDRAQKRADRFKSHIAGQTTHFTPSKFHDDTSLRAQAIEKRKTIEARRNAQMNYMTKEQYQALALGSKKPRPASQAVENK